MSLKKRLEEAISIAGIKATDSDLACNITVGQGKAILALLAAARYAAGSFAQVPAEKTVPPIVLHDCRKHLEDAIAAMETE